MKSRTLTCITAMTFFAALAVPLGLVAQEQQQEQKKEHTRYKLVDFGTFGGPSSYLQINNGVNEAPNQVVNSQGTVAGWGDTSTPDPYAPNCFQPYASDCFLTHAFQSQKGVLTDLGVLPGGDASTAAWISDTGLIAGQSRNGVIDPLIPGFAEFRAVLWQSGKIIDLGTLGGNESSAFAVNNRGQVVGVALNTIPDPFSFLATQLRAFLWQDGVMQDLGTLGGPEAWALFVNERGQVAGFSLINATPNPTTNFPTQDPFLWEGGTMIDLGTLGGTIGFPNALNNRGQVAGTSNLAGDLAFHPFLWDHGVLTDLGTFGGDNGVAQHVNDEGEVAGSADFPGDQIHHAALWTSGVMIDLGTVDGDPCSRAIGINSKGQIVGGSSSCTAFLHAFLWENGGPAIDLNTLVTPGSDLTLTEAGFINNRGEIAGAGVLPNGDTHAFLLIPCDGNDDGCRGENLTGVTQSSPAQATQQPTKATPANPALNPALSDRPGGMLDRLRSRWGQRYRIPGSGTGPTN